MKKQFSLWVIVVILILSGCTGNILIKELPESIYKEVKKPVFDFGDEKLNKKYDCRITDPQQLLDVVNFIINGEVFQWFDEENINTFQNPVFEDIDPDLQNWWKRIIDASFRYTNSKFNDKSINTIEGLEFNVLEEPAATGYEEQVKVYQKYKDNLYRVLIRPTSSQTKNKDSVSSHKQLEIVFHKYNRSGEQYQNAKRILIDYNYLYLVKIVSPNGGEAYKPGDIIPISWYSSIKSKFNFSCIKYNDNFNTNEKPVLFSYNNKGQFNLTETREVKGDFMLNTVYCEAALDEGEYKIKLNTRKHGICDYSDNSYFINKYGIKMDSTRIYGFGYGEDGDKGLARETAKAMAGSDLIDQIEIYIQKEFNLINSNKLIDIADISKGYLRNAKVEKEDVFQDSYLWKYELIMSVNKDDIIIKD